MRSITHLMMLFIVINTTAQAQTSRYISMGRLKASTHMQRIQSAKQLQDLSPDFWEQMGMPYEFRLALEKRRVTASAEGYYVYPADKNFGKYLAITAATITAWQGGKSNVEIIERDEINNDLRRIMAQAERGTDIAINLLFIDRQASTDSLANKVREGSIHIHVVPNTEAEFPGGNGALSSYLHKHIGSYFPEGKENFALGKSRVSFTVNEDGSVSQVRMTSSSGDKKVDAQVIKAIEKMPLWKPAEEDKKNVKQDITIPFNNDGC